MKVGFDFDPFNGDETKDGKHRFLIRLAKQFENLGVVINNDNPDIGLYLCAKIENKNAKIKVVRLDGLIMNTRWDYKKKNKYIKKVVSSADALIYQGDFCEEAYRKFLGINKTFKIIPNGCDPDEFKPRNPNNYFIANSKWRPHKRLKQTVKCFLLALEKGMDADLIVTGKPDYKYKHKRIKYVGWKTREDLVKLFAGAIASIHLTWLDWCPNSMVEAITSRCPVIYTKSGGQTQLGEGSGIGIKDTQWEFNLIDLYNPPKLNREEVSDAMIYLKDNKDKNLYPYRENLDIKNVAKEYISYFENLLKGK